MSRFFASVNDSDSESSDEEEVAEPVRLQVLAYSSDEEDDKRVVKTAKHKLVDDTKAIALTINNFKKIKDYAGLLTRFEDLVKIYGKYSTEFKDGSTPGIYISCLAELHNFVCSAWEDVEGRKQLTKIGFKSLTALRQKIRKFCKTFETDLEEYTRNPNKFLEVEVVKPEVKLEERDRSPSPVWDVTSESESDSSSDDLPYNTLREKFLKKTTQKADKTEKKDKKKREVKKEETDENQNEWETVVRGGTAFSQPPQMFMADTEITTKTLIEKLEEVATRRGTKRSDRNKQLNELYDLASKKELGPGVLVKIKIAQIAAIFDYNMVKHDAMKLENWAIVLKNVINIADVILAEDFEIVGDAYTEETFEEAPYKIRLNLAALTERLLEEHKKMLKEMGHDINLEYLMKLNDDQKIIGAIDKFISFAKKKDQEVAHNDLCRLIMSKIELIYYKFSKQAASNADDELFQQMDEMCKFVYLHDTQRLRTRAILAQIYHLALHDRWHTARDLMLMSHLQNSIEFADIETQILFNRTMAQLGLCAFRHGHVQECHECLVFLIRGGSKTRLLLGQGIYRPQSREQELKEKKQTLPTHMEIPVNLINCCFMVSAMFVELSQMLEEEGAARFRNVSKSFKYLINTSYWGQRLPPETPLEFSLEACRAMADYNWRECRDLIFNPTMDLKVWNKFEYNTLFKKNIIRLIQKQALQLFVKNYAVQVYESVSLWSLSIMFELSMKDIKGILGAMIDQGGLRASIRLDDQTIVFSNGLRSSGVHILATQLTDTCMQLLEQSERGVFGNDRQFYRKTANSGRQVK